MASSSSASSSSASSSTPAATREVFSRGCSYSEEIVASVLDEVSLLLSPPTEDQKGKKKYREPLISDQWVAQVLAFSSEYNSTTWSARTVVGPPRVYPQYGDIHGAWAQGSVGAELEYLVLKYDKPVVIQAVRIYETNCPGAVVRILALDQAGLNTADTAPTTAPTTTLTATPTPTPTPLFANQLSEVPAGTWVELWSGPPTHGQHTQSRIFEPALHRTDVASNIIRIEMNCRGAPTWCEIDCVQLHGDEMVDNAAFEAAMAKRKAEASARSSSLGESLGQLLVSGEYSDVLFVVQGRELKAHRNILSVRCPVFRSMFSHDTIETRLSRVTIPDINFDAFSRLVQFMYTGTVNVDASVVAWLYFAADKYDINEVRLACVEEFRYALTVDNVVPVFERVADLFPELKAVCMKFMICYASEIARGSSLEQLPPHLLLEVAKAFATSLKK